MLLTDHFPEDESDGSLIISSMRRGRMKLSGFDPDDKRKKFSEYRKKVLKGYGKDVISMIL